MLKLEKLDIQNTQELSFIEKLYVDSFPHSERRPFSKMIDLYSNFPRFFIEVARKGNEFIGFLTYWTFDNFVFAEHFAIAAESRNGGVGGKVMKLFMQAQILPIVLEVELPTTIIADRRIGFYQRLGYKLWGNISYYQPPYHEGYNPIPMYLMTYGKFDMGKEFTLVKEKLYSEVYNC